MVHWRPGNVSGCIPHEHTQCDDAFVQRRHKNQRLLGPWVFSRSLCTSSRLSAEDSRVSQSRTVERDIESFNAMQIAGLQTRFARVELNCRNAGRAGRGSVNVYAVTPFVATVGGISHES